MASNPSKRLKPPSILEFQQRFSTEDDCVRFLFKMRWPGGWVCPRCGGSRYYKIKSRGLYECPACRYQTSVTAGTVLHKTRTPLRTWFMAIFLMVTDKRGISSVGLAKQLGISQKKAWCMLHKLRKAMGKREEGHKLDGLVELGESFFGDPREGGCRGRNSFKNIVLIGLSFSAEGVPRHVRLKVLPHMDRVHLEPSVAAMAAPGTRIRTDGLRCYASLGGKGFLHDRIVKSTGIPAEARWLHTVVSNAKAMIGGTYHGLGRMGGKHLQAYLDEYSYRFNRRYRLSLIFDRCVSAVAACPIWTYKDIVGRKAASKKSRYMQLKIS